MMMVDGNDDEIMETPHVEESTEGEDTVSSESRSENSLLVLDSVVNVMILRCAVCQYVIERDSTAIQPCRCGYYVHHDCLLSAILQLEAGHPAFQSVGCPDCSTRFNISPKRDKIDWALEVASRTCWQLCKAGCLTLGVVFADIFITIQGFHIFVEIYGLEVAKYMIFSMHPITATMMCKTIPLIAVAVNFIPWEDKLLSLLRWGSKLPVVGRFFPSLYPGLIEDHRRTGLLDGCVMGFILLQCTRSVAALFSFVEHPLLGALQCGAAILGLKGCLQMYYRQKMYSRHAVLAVAPYQDNQIN